MTVYQESARSTGTRTSKRWLSPTLFTLVVLALFLPFATVSCDGAETSFTGVQLVTYSVPHGGAIDESSACSADISTCVEDAGSAPATVALLAAALGALLGLLHMTKGPGWCAALGLVATLWIGLRASGTMADVSLRAGYWIMLLLFVWAAALHGRRARQRRKRRRSTEACVP